MKQLERKVRSLQYESYLLQKTNEEVIGSSGEEKTVVRNKIEKVAKIVPTRFVGMFICISRAISKWCKRGIFELNQFGAPVLELYQTPGKKFHGWN